MEEIKKFLYTWQLLLKKHIFPNCFQDLSNYSKLKQNQTPKP